MDSQQLDHDFDNRPIYLVGSRDPPGGLAGPLATITQTRGKLERSASKRYPKGVQLDCQYGIRWSKNSIYIYIICMVVGS